MHYSMLVERLTTTVITVPTCLYRLFLKLFFSQYMYLLESKNKTFELHIGHIIHKYLLEFTLSHEINGKPVTLLNLEYLAISDSRITIFR